MPPPPGINPTDQTGAGGGTGSDINQATKLARAMVMQYGMSSLGAMEYGENEQEIFLGRAVARHQQMSEDTSKKVDAEIKKIVDEGYEKAKKILTDKLEDLYKLAKALITYETLSGEEIKDLILKNIHPKRSSDENDKDNNAEDSSALGSLGLKPKPAH